MLVNQPSITDIFLSPFPLLKKKQPTKPSLRAERIQLLHQRHAGDDDHCPVLPAVDNWRCWRPAAFQLVLQNGHHRGAGPIFASGAAQIAQDWMVAATPVGTVVLPPFAHPKLHPPVIKRDARNVSFRVKLEHRRRRRNLRHYRVHLAETNIWSHTFSSH